jgi:hypothetical protein
MIPARGPLGEPLALPVDLHEINTAASPAVRHDAMSWEGREGTEDTTGREATVTAASLLILVPWLVFAAGLTAIGLRLLILRRHRRRR